MKITVLLINTPSLHLEKWYMEKGKQNPCDLDFASKGPHV